MTTLSRLDTHPWNKAARVVSVQRRSLSAASYPVSSLYRSLRQPYKGRFSVHICISRCMKRVNPDTNKEFKRGDVREDGYVFFNYTSKVKADGFFMERWLSPTASLNAKSKDRMTKKASYQRKTDRKPPGYHQLPLKERRYLDQLAKVEKYKLEFPDMTQEDIDELLLGY